MYTNFTTYWDYKKEVLLKLGITEVMARMIWNDAVDCVGDIIINNLDKHIKDAENL